MTERSPRTLDDDATARGRALLSRIGWHPADLIQIQVYALMPPARKVEQMLRLRHGQMRVLEARLRREHSDYGPVEFARLVQAHLDLVREVVPHE